MFSEVLVGSMASVFRKCWVSKLWFTSDAGLLREVEVIYKLRLTVVMFISDISIE